MLQAFVDESERADIVGLKPDRFNAYGTAEEAAEKRLFCALRFATAQACGSEEVLFFRLTALFRFAHPWLKAMGYQVVP